MLVPFLLLTTVVFSVLGNDSNICSRFPKQKSLEECFDYVNKKIYASEKLNWKCVRKSCPALDDVKYCPYNENGSLNMGNINEAAEILTACFNRREPICGVPLEAMAIPACAAPLWKPEGISNITRAEICTGTGEMKIYNFTQVKFNAKNDGGNSKSIIFDINLRDFYISGSVHSVVTVDWPLLKLPPLPFSNIPLTADYTHEVELKVDLGNKPPTFEISKTVAKGRYHFVSLGMLKSPLIGPILNATSVLDLLTYSMQGCVTVSNHARDVANFYAAYVISALRVTQNACPSKVNASTTSA